MEIGSVRLFVQQHKCTFYAGHQLWQAATMVAYLHRHRASSPEHAIHTIHGVAAIDFRQMTQRQKQGK
jgi:hypothetical protein